MQTATEVGVRIGDRPAIEGESLARDGKLPPRAPVAVRSRVAMGPEGACGSPESLTLKVEGYTTLEALGPGGSRIVPGAGASVGGG